MVQQFPLNSNDSTDYKVCGTLWLQVKKTAQQMYAQTIRGSSISRNWFQRTTITAKSQVAHAAITMFKSQIKVEILEKGKHFKTEI